MFDFFFVRATSALKDLLRNHVSQRTIDENRRASRERVTADGDKEIGMEDVCFAHYLRVTCRVVFREFDLIRGWKSFCCCRRCCQGARPPPSLYLCCLVAGQISFVFKPSQSVLNQDGTLPSLSAAGITAAASLVP